VSQACELSESVHEQIRKLQDVPEGDCEAPSKIDLLFNKPEGAIAGLVCCHQLGPTAVDFRASRPDRNSHYVGCRKLEAENTPALAYI
jgi:hypothetical protein